MWGFSEEDLPGYRPELDQVHANPRQWRPDRMNHVDCHPMQPSFDLAYCRPRPMDPRAGRRHRRDVTDKFVLIEYRDGAAPVPDKGDGTPGVIDKAVAGGNDLSGRAE